MKQRNNNRSAQKKTKLRKRILAAFSCVLFFSYAIMAITFNTVMSVLDHINGYEHYFLNQQRFIVGRAGLTQLILVGVMFVVSVIATYFLSNSITRPIEKLGKFASEIGKGNFDANDFVFKDEELENLNTALNKSVKQLGIYDSEQKTFFQNASHELRTPLMSIKCYAEGITFGLMDPKKASETILQETDRLSELVADLLYISKIDNISTAYTTTEVNLAEIIQDSISRQQAMADKRQIGFFLDIDNDAISYMCVKELMSRAIDNLISNGIRYANTKITLSCRKSHGNIIITVEDDGKGIEPEILPHVFERFYKGSNGNTGIGLAIVKSIIDQLGGRIKAENSANGAVFTITLPLHDKIS